MKKSLKIIKNILLAFVLVSIGFALGKNYSDVKIKSKNDVVMVKAKNTDLENRMVIHVYYMHSTFRCATCNTIEKMTKKLLNTKYSEEMNKKEILFSDVDFQSNEHLAKKFGVVSSCVVVAIEKNGKIIDFKRLDEVWTLMERPEKFNSYISRTIKDYLNKENLKNGDHE